MIHRPRQRLTASRCCVAVGVMLTAGLALTACGDDDGAVTDLDEDQLQLDDGLATIMLMPDRFPNLAHKCYPEEGVPVGAWAVTDRDVWIVYNDPLCPGYSRERETFVLSNVPGEGPVASSDS